MRIVIQILLWPLPWPARRYLLSQFFGFSIAPEARIGKSVILAEKLIMAPHSSIGSLTFVKGARLLQMDEYAIIGNLNWITATSKDNDLFFKDQNDRDPVLIVRKHAAITNRHLIDCTDTVEIGSFATVGGWNSQILTHSIDVTSSRQRAGKVSIGSYAFVGTRAILLKNSSLPERCILSAGSVLTTNDGDLHGLYSGNPAKRVKELDPTAGYFTRDTGFVW